MERLRGHLLRDRERESKRDPIFGRRWRSRRRREADFGEAGLEEWRNAKN